MKNELDFVKECPPMNKYEDMLQRLSLMSPDEKNVFLESNRSLCVCPKCPTYSECMRQKEERMFCWYEKSPCPVTPTGCLCPTCPVAALMGYSHTYYCSGGTERELRDMN
jgi:hypothetical protein